MQPAFDTAPPAAVVAVAANPPALAEADQPAAASLAPATATPRLEPASGPTSARKARRGKGKAARRTVTCSRCGESYPTTVPYPACPRCGGTGT
jgi:hypothetical protein